MPKQWYHLPSMLVIKLIQCYRLFVSPLLGSNCRFHPTCSCYAHQAFEQYGFFKGAFFTMRRLIKCHPYHSGGFDPLPENTNQTTEIN